MFLRTALPLAAAAALCACSGAVPASGVPIAGAAQGSLLLRVSVPLHRRSHYLSPATRGMSVSITGPTKFQAAVGLEITDAGCSSTLTDVECSLVIPGLQPCPGKANCYTATVATYDAFDAATGKIPKSARKLSADDDFTFAVASGQTVIPIVLEGIPSAIAFIPSASSSLTGNRASGYVEPKCTASQQRVSLLALDADGNYILGAGTPSIALTSSDPAQLAAVRTGSATPHDFFLDPPRAPGYPFGNHVVHLLATATPGSRSGGIVRHATIDVAYSGDICGTVTEFALPNAGSDPFGIAPGPDGKMWFTEDMGNKVGRISTAGSIQEFSVPTASANPADIVAGPDGHLWFTEICASKIGRISTTGAATEYPTPTAASEPWTIVAGPDRNLWFTEYHANNVAKITTGGVTTEYPIPTAGSGPVSVASGPDGALWFVEATAGKIGRVTTAGSFSETPIPTTGTAPTGIAAGPNGALWFAECAGNAVGEITTAGAVVGQFPLPEANSTPVFDVLGPDGAMWVSEANGNRIARVTAGGSITELAVPTGGAMPYGLAVGPDGAIWFTEFHAGKIARLR